MNISNLSSSLNAFEELMGFFSDKKKSNLFFDGISYLAEADRFFSLDVNTLAFFHFTIYNYNTLTAPIYR